MRKTKAQGMVEFALILPLLLVLMFGVIEIGRLLFIKAVVTSTSREAARFGTAVGDSPNGVAYYRDCAGIRGAAQRVGVLVNLPDTQIDIRYTHSDGSEYGSCPVGSNPGPRSDDLGDRVGVSVTASYSPLLPIVPLPAFNITSSTERLIVKEVSVGAAVVPPPYTATTTATPGDTLTPTVTPTPTETQTPTQTQTPTLTATHTATPTDTPTPTITLTATPGPSSTPTSTPTNTQTPTPTPTPTLTNTPTPTATATAVCNGITASFSAPSYTKLELNITNGQAGTIRMEKIVLFWPNSASENKYLNTIRMNGSEIWSGDKVSTSPLTILNTQWVSGSEEIREIAGGATDSVMQFLFDKNAVSNGYNITITFSNGCSRNAVR